MNNQIIIELAKALEDLISHTLQCEEQLDRFHGLGNDSGSGYSAIVCNAQSALKKYYELKNAQPDK